MRERPLHPTILAQRTPIPQLLTGIYRAGPVLITAIIILASIAYAPWFTKRDDPYILDLIFLCWGAAAIWHVALIVSATERPRREMVFYAFIHLPAMALITLTCIGFMMGPRWFSYYPGRDDPVIERQLEKQGRLVRLGPRYSSILVYPGIPT
jgi:hypothetical protein